MPQVLAVADFKVEFQSYTRGVVINFSDLGVISSLRARRVIVDRAQDVAAAIAEGASQVVHVPGKAPLPISPQILRDGNGVATGLVDPLTGGAVGGDSDGYRFPSFSGGDDTALLQEFLDDMSSDAQAAKRQIKVVLPKNETGLIAGGFLRSNLDIDLNGSRILKIANNSGVMASSHTVAVLRSGPWSKNGNTWYGNADNITIRNGTLDTNNKDSLAVLDLHGVRNFHTDGLTLITSQWSRNWAIRGGGFGSMINGRLLGSAGLFQDGLHWQYGGMIFDNWYVEAGDDALAAGDDAVNANVYMDDQALEYFIARNIQVKAARGAAIKVYTPLTKPFSAAPNNYTKTGRVRNVDVQVTGKSGLLRNGGVSVFSHVPSTATRNPDDLRGIRVHADLEVGTAGNAVWDAVSGVLVGSPTAVSAADPVVVSLAGHGLPAGKVVHLIPAAGGMNNLNGFYQVMATNLSANSFQLSDIAYRNNVALNGVGFSPWTTGQLIAVGSGSGYSVNDELTVSGGTFVRPAKWLVTQVDANGAVEAVRRLDEGEYTVLPATPNVPSGGSGTGCTLHLFMQHDGVNAYGVKSYAGKDVVVSGQILINDTTAAAAARFRSFQIVDSEGVEVRCAFPRVPANGGAVFNESAQQLSKGNVINSRMVCNGALSAAMSPVMLSNSEGTVVSGSIEALPTGTYGVQFPVNGNTLHPRSIVSIGGAANSTFQVAHGNWKAGTIVSIYNNQLSTGSLDGYYVIRRVYGDSSFALRTLAGAQVALGALTVVAPGNIEVANNTAKLKDLKIRPAPNVDGHTGVGAASNSPARVSSLTIEGCDFFGLATAVDLNVQAAPCGYSVRDSKL